MTQLAEYGRQQRAERPQFGPDQIDEDATRPAPLRLVPNDENAAHRGTFRTAIATIASAVVLLVAIGGVSLLIGSHAATQTEATVSPPTAASATSNATIDPSPVDNTVPAPASRHLAQRRGVVEAMMSTANDARLPDYMALFAPRAILYGSPHDEPSQEALMAANVTWAFHGDARSSCVAGDGGDLTCYAVTLQDEFHGAAGLSIRADFSFTFDTQNRITSIEVDRSERSRLSAPFGQQGLSQQAAFASSFLQWLGEAHPDVAASMSPPTANGMPGASDIPVVLGYLTEFMAQSDLYPQQSTGIPYPPTP